MSIFGQLQSIRISNQLINEELESLWDVLSQYESVLFLAGDYADQIIQDMDILKIEVAEISSDLIHLQDLQARQYQNLQKIRTNYLEEE